MSFSGMVDLHCHYLPAVDDGVRTAAEGVALCQALRQLGYSTVIATPHIRSGMFENRKPGLVQTFEVFSQLAAAESGMPTLGLGAEHFCDDVFVDLFERGETLPYPGGHAALVEFPPERIPLKIEERFFRMNVRGVRPVVAHPERYAPVFRSSEPVAALVDHGALLLLDIMSLTGHYGRKAERAAGRLLEDGLYYAACSDSHKPADAEIVAQGIDRLVELLGTDDARELLVDHPCKILEGTVED